MARITVGATAVIGPDGTVASAAGETGTLYRTLAGATQITDVLDAAGDAIPGGIITATEDGLCPLVKPEVGAEQHCFVSFGGGPRQVLHALDLNGGALSALVDAKILTGVIEALNDPAVYDPATAGLVTNRASVTGAALRAIMPQVSVKDFGATPGASAATNTAAIRAAFAASQNVYFPPGDYAINWDAGANRRNFLTFTDVDGIRISGVGARLVDSTTFLLNGLNSVFHFSGCKDIDVQIGYVGTVMPQPDREASLDKLGATVTYFERNETSGRVCDRIKVNIACDWARYGVRSGDYGVAARGGCTDMDLTVRGTGIGYPVALWNCTVRSVSVEVAEFHRAAYLAGVQGIGKAPVRVSCRNEYGAIIAVLVTNALAVGSPLAIADRVTVGSRNLDISATDTGSTTWKTQTSLTGLAMNYVTNAEVAFEDLSFRFSVRSSDTVAACIGGFTLESAVDPADTPNGFRWEPSVRISNVTVGGTIDRAGQTAATNSLGELYVRAYDGTDTTFAHVPRVSNFVVEDLTYIKGTVQTRPFFIEIPGLVDTMTLSRVRAPGVTVSLSAPNASAVAQNGDVAAFVASPAPHSLKDLVLANTTTGGVTSARITTTRPTGTVKMGWTSAQTSVLQDTITSTGTATVTCTGWIKRGAFIKAILLRITTLPAGAAGQVQLGTPANPTLFGTYTIAAGVNRVTASSGVPAIFALADTDLRITFVPTDGVTYPSGPLLQSAVYSELYTIDT